MWDKDIIWFQISMCNAIFMEIAQPLKDILKHLLDIDELLVFCRFNTFYI